MRQENGWQFWIDRGGTFTDIVARQPDGVLHAKKLLSTSNQYADAAIEGIDRLLNEAGVSTQAGAMVSEVRMGTTIATNALLERRGERLALMTTRGFGDALRIAYQNRPDIFAREICLPEMLYETVIEIDERIAVDGSIIQTLDESSTNEKLIKLRDAGYDALAIVFVHAWQYPQHEQRVAALAREAGFSQVSTSHDSAALIKLISRGDTTVVDAYLTPLLRRYVDAIDETLAKRHSEPKLRFMQSDGGLVDAHRFYGRNSILSGPAAGVVAMAKAGAKAGADTGNDKLIGFDMGGTSTDVSLYAGNFERSYDSEVAGVRLRSPMMRIHTVAAGGGSRLRYRDQRLQVGPDSAGANPGPACYRQSGPLCITDANLLLGRIHERYFPEVFGAGGDQPLDRVAAEQGFDELAKTLRADGGNALKPAEIADGFVHVAVENMANAIKIISVRRGQDAQACTLYCFGGAAGQLACRVAESLGMTRILVHPLAGVLSALGMGLAEIRQVEQRTIGERLEETVLAGLHPHIEQLGERTMTKVREQIHGKRKVTTRTELHCRYHGSDTVIPVVLDKVDVMVELFEAAHSRQYGFAFTGTPIVIESLVVAAETVSEDEDPQIRDEEATSPAVIDTLPFYSGGDWHEANWFDRAQLSSGIMIDGPAVVVDPGATTVVDPGWRLTTLPDGHLLLEDLGRRDGSRRPDSLQADPVLLEVFNNLFMHAATQMGAVLQNTARSVNIKERLDFSCALFDADGGLIANAPHMPVHLGSMGDSVKTVIRKHRDMRPGDAFILNSPYNGGTHLPDITVVTPVFLDEAKPDFYVASRAHHADIGGITPGSMPPHSRHIDEEGVLLDNLRILRDGALDADRLSALFRAGDWPSRNTEQNIEDIKAQIAANRCGIREIEQMGNQYGLAMVKAYTKHVQANAEESVRRAIDGLSDGSFSYEMDNGQQINVAITVDKKKRCATIDFARTSAQSDNNFNAPRSVCYAAVLYVFRTLVDHAIPLNEGCLKPLKVIIPDGCMLSPSYPAAVVAGNVETSQYVVDALYGALGIQAAAQGTMNNLTFGDEHWQYYETVCGGAGAGPNYDGCDAVHTHMTNSRLTDPEILEQRFPVRLQSFSIRAGSGGIGKHRGGDGVCRRIEFLAPMNAAILSGHRRVAPFGLAGGGDGQTGSNYLLAAGGKRVELDSADVADVKPGDVLVIETPGGGAYGAAASDKAENHNG